MKKDGPDILVFPPLMSVVVPVVALLLEWLVPLGLLPLGQLWLILPGVVVFGIAGWLVLAGERAFRQADTNVDPRKPSLLLVRDGPFRFTRNPMYLGMVLFQIGMALTFAVDWALIGAVVVWAVLHFGVVLREEAYLTATFGADYTHYCSERRRWV